MATTKQPKVPITFPDKLDWLFANCQRPDGSACTHKGLARYLTGKIGKKYYPPTVTRWRQGATGGPRWDEIKPIGEYFGCDPNIFDPVDAETVAQAMQQTLVRQQHGVHELPASPTLDLTGLSNNQIVTLTQLAQYLEAHPGHEVELPPEAQEWFRAHDSTAARPQPVEPDEPST